MKSDITLRLDQGAICSAVPTSHDFSPSVGRATENRSTALLWAIGARNIGITGEGVIDGNGRAFIAKGHPHSGLLFYDPSAAHARGRRSLRATRRTAEGPVEMLPLAPGSWCCLSSAKMCIFRDFNVVDAPNWCIHLACCRHAVISGLNVRNSLLIPNADALDVANCQDVRISDVYLEAGDDGIAISPCADGYCSRTAENITVSNAVIVSRSAGIRLG